MDLWWRRGRLFFEDALICTLPPEIHNSTAPLYSLGDPIEAGVFNASNRAEEISLLRNQGLEVYDDTEPAPEKFPLVSNSAADTLFEG